MQHRVALAVAALCLVGAVGATASFASRAAAPKINPIFTYNKPDREQYLYDCAKKEGSVTLYSSASITDAIYKPAWAKLYPGVTLNTYVATTQLIPRLKQEEDAGHHNFDVLNDTIGNFGRDGKYFQPFWSPNMAKAQKGLASPYFLANAGFLFPGLYYNPNLISASDVPKTWKDLLKPQYTGKIYIGNDGTSPVVTGLLRKVYGKSYYEALAKQVRVQNVSGRGIADQIIAGTIPMGIEMSSAYYKLNHLNQGAPLLLQVMSPMYGSYSAASISKYTTHPCASMLLVDWLNSTAPDGAQPILNGLGVSSPYKGSDLVPFQVDGQLPQSKWNAYFGTDPELYKGLGFKNWAQAYAYWSKLYYKYFINGG